MIRCCDGSLYTGYTSDLERRIKEHGSSRGAKYLRGKMPLNLVWYKEYKYLKKALQMETKIKKLTKKEKESIVGGKRLDKVFKLKKKI